MNSQPNSKHIKKILHDINSPLTTILGYSDLLKKKHNPEWAETIKSEAYRISELVNELQSIFDEH